MANITIQTDQGDVPVRAKVCGPLAVHHSIFEPELFTITHLATGYAVSGALQGMDREKAEFFASRLSNLPLWDFKRPNHARPIRDKFCAAWNRINAEWKSQRANAVIPQPVNDPPEERQKQKEVRA